VPQLPSQPSISEELDRLEDDLRRLKIEFDVFFAGGSKRPPIDTRNRIETVMRRLGDDRSLRFEQRYRFNSLSTRYNVFRDLWRRMMQQREEGRWNTGYFRSVQQKAEAAQPPATPAPARSATPAAAQPAAAAPAHPASQKKSKSAAASAQSDAASITLSDPLKEPEKVRALFDMILEKKKAAGEDTKKVSYTQFSKLIRSRTDQVKAAGQCTEVTYNVTVENGSVKFSAKGKRS
jgi:hypothetical protein